MLFFLQTKSTLSVSGVKNFSSINNSPPYLVLFVVILQIPNVTGKGCFRPVFFPLEIIIMLVKPVLESAASSPCVSFYISWSVFERMTYTLYPHPPYYFVTLSKLTESRFFFNHPPTFSDNVTLYHVFFLTASLNDLICS